MLLSDDYRSVQVVEVTKLGKHMKCAEMIISVFKKRDFKCKAGKTNVLLVLIFCFSFCCLSSYAGEDNKYPHNINLEPQSGSGSNLIFIPLSSLGSDGIFPLIPFLEKNLDKEPLNQRLEKEKDELGYGFGNDVQSPFDKEDIGYEKHGENTSPFLSQNHTIIVGMMRMPRDSGEGDEEEGEGHDAARVEDVRLCREMLRAAFEKRDYVFIVNFLLERQYTSGMSLNEVLFLACKYGARRIVSVLLFLGADPSIQDRKGWTALHYLCSPHLSFRPDSCINLDMMRQLIEKMKSLADGDINISNYSGDTPLHTAAEYGCLLQARLLLKNGADPQAINNDEQTPAEVAHDAGEHRLERLLTNAFDDEEASDTDSEDEADYDDLFVDLSAQISRSNRLVLREGFAREPPLQYHASDGSRIDFQEERIIPNGDCGFIGMGIEREDLRVLFNFAGYPEAREEIWQEIAGAILAGEFIPGVVGIEEVLRFFATNDENALQRLREYCLREDVFRAYIEALMKSRMWIGQQTMLAYARAMNISLYIWRRENDGSNRLVLDRDRHHVAHDDGIPPQEIHLLHTAGFTHFNLLVRRADREVPTDREMVRTVPICIFRSKPISDSSSNRSTIPVQTDQ